MNAIAPVSLAWKPPSIKRPSRSIGVIPSSANRGDWSSLSGAPETSARQATTFDSRQLFRAAPSTAARRSNRSNVTLSELSRGLRLLGILGGEDPRAIISDTKTGKTLHVRPGEHLGEIRILEVHANRVVLGWKEETVEWTL